MYRVKLFFISVARKQWSNDYTFIYWLPGSNIGTFMSDWLKGIKPASQSSSKTEDSFIFESYSEWWSSMGEIPRIFRSSVKLWLLFRYGNVSLNNDNGGWFFVNRDDNEGCELDRFEGWPKMLVRSCWLDGTVIAEINNHWQKLWAYNCFRTDF